MINKQMFQFPILYAGPIGRVAIGWGAHQTVADECKKAGINKALITTTGLKGTGIVDEINQILTTNGVATEIYNKVTSNPKDYEVMEAYNVFKEAECDGVVSIGGGSSHDCGKGVRVVAANDGKHICDFAMVLDPPWMEERLKYKPVTIPQISVNTTAGTSAEITAFATITNTKLRSKQLLSVPGMVPTIAIVDPLLIRLMPKNIAAWTGFDALAHCFEGYLARIHPAHAAALCLRGIQMVAENLREFTYNPMNHVACENMCMAESIGGLTGALGSAPGIVHGLGHQIGGVTDYHHGHINATMTIPGERYNEVVFPERFAEMAQVMGVDTKGMTKMQAADKWFDEMERILADLDIQTGHLNEQFGLQKEDCKHIVTIFSNDLTREGNPRHLDLEEVLKLLEDNL